MPRVSKPATKRNHPVERQINKPKTEEKRILIPSGSLMLNLACSNTWHGAYEVGRMSNLIGDSSSGKTYLALEMMAQCCMDKRFDDYALIYDDVEHALSMDIEGLFGPRLAKRIEGPEGPIDTTDPSRTVEDLQFNICHALDSGPCIYVVDSFDALTTEQDIEKLNEQFKARQKGVDIAGSYRMAKPKKASEMLQDVVSKLEKTKSFLLIISQTRDNVTPGTFEKRTRSGGRALKFYAQHEIWLAVTGKMKQTVHGKERVVGSNLKVKVSKNKLTGSFREVEFNFRHGYGCDDITSALNFLKQEGLAQGGIKWTWGNYSGSLAQLISRIEDDNLERKLFRECQTAWLEVEELLKPKRKSKYEE